MTKSISKNRKAWHDYHIEKKIEAGLVLKGSEVKTLRKGQASISEGYAIIRDGQAWLVNSYIPTLQHASYMNHSERRDRKLLMWTKEIQDLDRATTQKGFTIVPLELYFDQNNRVKIELGLAKGKTNYDKRSSAKEKDVKREIQRAIKR